MEGTALTADLTLIAERRAALSALLGLLILGEPGPGLAELIGAIPALAALGSGDPAIATEYERVFLRGVPMYESVFRSDDGQHGGETISALVERYDRLGFTEFLEQRWRIAGPDHLGLQLRCLAHLCSQEAAAWRDGTPDKAMEAVEAERTFLAHHLAGWAPVAIQCALRHVGEGAYVPVLRAIADHLSEEFDRLRPAPDLGSQVECEPLPTNLGPARLSRLILAPATCGTWIDSAVIGLAARSIGAPWRPSDTRSSLRHVIADAETSGDLHIVLEPIAERLDVAITAHQHAAECSPGNAANARRWALTAATMRERLASIAETGMYGRDRLVDSETFTVSGPDADQLADAIDELVTDLRRQGLCVQRHTDQSSGLGTGGGL